MDSRQLSEEAYKVQQAMQLFGGSFMKQIGSAMCHADSRNLRKIHDTWPNEWNRYLEMYDAYNKRLQEADDEER